MERLASRLVRSRLLSVPIWWATAGLVVCSLAGPARAGDGEQSSDAERAYRRGVEAYESGDYDEAVRLLRRAHRQVPSATLLYNVALAEWRAGELGDALSTAREVDPEGLEARLRPQLRGRRRAFASALRSREVASSVSNIPDRPDPAPRTEVESDPSFPWGGVVLSGIGLSALGATYGIERRIASEAGELREAGSRGDTEAYNRQLRAVHRLQVAGRITLGVGAAATAVGLGLLFHSSARSSDARSRDVRPPRFRVVLQPGRAGLGVRFY